MKMQAEIDDGKWIIGVRKQITDANPKIIVGRIYNIFTHDSRSMEFFHDCYEEGDTPAECFEKFIKKFGKETIGL
jgi:hypothetical protein